MSHRATVGGMPRSEYLDFVKGYLILSVTVGHAFQYGIHHDIGHWGDPWFRAIYMFHMPLFMAVAGYLSYPGIGREPFVAFAWKRTRAFAVPIFFWATLYKTLSYLTLRKHGLSELPASVLEKAFNYLWFLWALLAAQLLAAAIRIVAPNHFWPAYLAAIALALAIPDRFASPTIKFMLPFFAIGLALAERGVPRLGPAAGIALYALSLAACAVVFHHWTDDTYVYVSGMDFTADNTWNVVLRFAGGGVGSLAMILALAFVFRMLPRRIVRPFLPLGRDSIFIYILQGYAFVVIFKLGFLLPWPEPGSVAAPPAALAAGVAVACGCWLVGTRIARYPLAAAVLFGKFGK